MHRKQIEPLFFAFLGLALTSAAIAAPPRLATAADCLALAQEQSWGSSVKQIPSTVIDIGIMKHVPYTSYRAGDYEINVYGDPASPAGVEIGLYGVRAKATQSQKHCVAFMERVLLSEDDRNVLRTLNLTKDLKELGGLSFEVTPPGIPDAYGAWWISVYNKTALDAARASENELAEITEPKTPQGSPTIKGEAPARTKATGGHTYAPSWSSSELAESRPTKSASNRTGDVVYVKAYYRKDGTYVHAHTRSKPSR